MRAAVTGSHQNNANERFAAQEYDVALDSYLGAQAANPDLPAPYYNAGNVYYRQSDYQAAQLYLQEAAMRGDETLDQAAFYNLGNVAFNTDDLNGAIEHYKEALRLNPADTDAKHNLELALQALEQQLQEEMEQQEQEQQEQDEPQPEEEQEQQDEPEDGSTPTPDPQSDQPEPTPQPDESQPEGEPTPSPEPSPDGENEQSGDEGESEGEQAQDAPPTMTPTAPPTPDTRGRAGEEPQQPGDMQQMMPAGGQQLSEEQARQLLNAIGRRTETLQERLQQIHVAPGGPPAQDW